MPSTSSCIVNNYWLIIPAFILCLCSCSILTPSSSDGITEYYTSNTDNEFQHEQIICNTSTCIVECNHNNTCYNTTINSTKADKVSIICREEYSCNRVNWFHDDSSTKTNYSHDLDLQCLASRACLTVSFLLSNADNVNITCSNPIFKGDGSCSYASMNISNTNNVNIHCQSLYSCDHTKIDILYANNSIIECKDYGCLSNDVNVYSNNNILISVNGMNATYNSSFNFDSSNNAHLICNNGGCKHSDYYFDNVDIAIIECKQPFDCYSSRFHGFNANSMQIFCETADSCSATTIECPSDYKNQCNLTLSATNSNHIYVYNNNSNFADRFINIDCQSLSNDCGTIYSICIHPALSVGIYINGLQVTTLLSYNNITNTYYKCKNNVILNDNVCCPYKPHIDCNPNEDCIIDCNQGQCYKATINASEATSLTISCVKNTSYACYQSIIHCPSTKNSKCDIDCNNPYSCVDAIIYYNAANKYIELSCSSYFSCFGISLYLTNSDINTNVKLYCNYSSACRDISIYAGIMSSGIIDCSATDSCRNGKFILIHTKKVMINCGNTGCKDSVINASQADSLQMICNESYSCYGSNVYPPYHAIGVVKLDCGHPTANVLNSCVDLLIFVGDDYLYGYLDLVCYDNFCKGMSVSCTDSGDKVSILSNYDETIDRNIYNSCENPMSCCPFKPPTFECDDHCSLDCGVDINCNYTILNAKNGKDMTVNCSLYEVCKETIIECPMNAVCTVNCITNYYKPCEYTTIIANIGTNLTVNCFGKSACYGVVIHAQFADNINVKCNQDITLRSSGDQYACYQVVVNADNVNGKVYVECKGNRTIGSDVTAGCKQMELNANYANQVVIENHGTTANIGSKIFANYTSQFIVACRQKPDVRGSNSVCSDLLLSGSQSSTLIGEGDNAYGALSIYSQTPMDDWNFDWNGCGQCESMSDCIPVSFSKIEWIFYCEVNGTMIKGDTFEGRSEIAADLVVECSCCGSNATKIQDSFYNDPSSCFYQEQGINGDNNNSDSILDGYGYLIWPSVVLIGLFCGVVLILTVKYRNRTRKSPPNMQESKIMENQNSAATVMNETEMVMVQLPNGQMVLAKLNQSRQNSEDDNPWTANMPINHNEGNDNENVANQQEGGEETIEGYM